MQGSETIKSSTTRTLQSGAALMIGLIMLVVIAILATSSTQTAVSELVMARNHQTHELAFQAAETGLEHILAATSFDTGRSVLSTRLLDARTSVHMLVEFVGQTGVPDAELIIDTEDGLAAYHFVGTATATVQRDPGAGSLHDVRTVHTQSFYVVGTGAERSPVRLAWRVEGIQ